VAFLFSFSGRKLEFIHDIIQMSDKKYINTFNNLAHCPFCRGVILKDLKVDLEAQKTSFLVRCPHCKKDISVTLQGHDLQIGEKKEE